MKQLATIVLLIFFSWPAFSCSARMHGAMLSHEELIDTTDTIVLAELVDTAMLSYFRTIEVIKGQPPVEFQWVKFRARQSHIVNDFDQHRSPEFWSQEAYRAPYPNGSCSPSLTFTTGERYLIFVESPGHGHSAEIIKSESDLWYLFVKERVAHKQVKAADAEQRAVALSFRQFHDHF
ncbi:hypothetical protein ABC502_15260 [Alkalimonas sp. NCh-2]|uniref:hypothetical protein n=1 Tax=Alkalimonas sp. NCh-2 TaxID=3144846 RepID=UPI0031F68A01